MDSMLRIKLQIPMRGNYNIPSASHKKAIRCD